MKICEIHRETFGGNKQAINRHSTRLYLTEEGLLYELDRNLSTYPPCYCVNGPRIANHEGVVRVMKVGESEYWGDGKSWTWAVNQFIQEITSRIVPAIDFFEEFGKDKKEWSVGSQSFRSYEFRGLSVIATTIDQTKWNIYCTNKFGTEYRLEPN